MNIVGVQIKGMAGGTFFTFSKGLLKQCHFDSNFTWSFNIAVILISIPVLNQCLVPFLREYRPNMRKKIAIGYTLVVLASVCMMAIVGAGELELDHMHTVDHKIKNSTREIMCLFTDMDKPGWDTIPVRSWVMIVPHFLVSLAEVFINISCE